MIALVLTFGAKAFNYTKLCNCNAWLAGGNTRAAESEVLSSDSDSGQFRLSDSNSDSGPTPTFSCISYL